MLLSPIRCCGPAAGHSIKRSVQAATNNPSFTKFVFGRRSYAKESKGSNCSSCCKEVDQTKGRKMEKWPKSETSPPGWRSQCPKDPQPINYDPYRIKVPEIAVPPLPPSNCKPMIDCTKRKGPCAMKPVLDPPPCPPDPPPPFPWMYVWFTAGFLSSVGIFYRIYCWLEERNKLGENKPIWHPRQKRKRPYNEQDLPLCAQYLIVGTGAAGWACYRAIMEHDKTAKVLFVTSEDILPYQRPPMSKWMWWNKEPPDLKSLFYANEGKGYTMYNAECRHFMDPVIFNRTKVGPAVSIISGWCVLRVDPDEHVIYIKTLCGEHPIYYERCLLAPGARPKQINAFKNAPKPVRKKITTLRTIRDLEISFRKVRAAKHVTIIGGGYLGCELAWYLGKMNKVVPREPEDAPPIEFAHIIKEKGVLSSIVPEYLGEWAAEKIKCENVKVIPQTQVYDAFVTKDDRLELTLSDGSSLVTDYVLVAVGAKPREELAERSYLEVDEINGGIKVNTELECRTHLFVAGDAASFFSQWRETRLRFEHYDNAEEQGNIAGGNMTGYWTPCNMEPHYEMKLGRTFQLHVIGEVGACMPTIALFKTCKEDPNMTKAQKEAEGLEDNIPCYHQPDDYQNRYKRGILFYLRDDTVVGMIFWNIPPIEDQVGVVTELLRAKPSYEDVNLLAELVGFQNAECVYFAPEELVKEETCMKLYVSNSIKRKLLVEIKLFLNVCLEDKIGVHYQ